MAAVPGLLTVLAVALITRSVQDALALFMKHVQSGRIRVPFLHSETVGATRRLLNVLLWGLALAVAYPFLPGSDSDVFKGLSVLFGLMITLGSTGVVTQLMSGLVVVYSRSLKKGDFVAVDGVEGVVSEVGALAVKIITMRNEEVTLPNAVITGNAIRNYSKLSGQQGTLLSTKVTIGYDTAWRQVHAMLVNAALVTPGVRTQPVPFVYQRALSDFYVEYELFAHIDRPLERVAILSALHAAIQDEFNRHGVQIMSPHFYDQPEQAVLVPPSRWHAAPAKPAP
jgi:small-conductance mechanosensitive channel